MYIVAKTRGGDKNISPDLLHHLLLKTVPPTRGYFPSLKDPTLLSISSHLFSFHFGQVHLLLLQGELIALTSSTKIFSLYKNMSTGFFLFFVFG